MLRLASLYQRLDARDVAPHLWLAMAEDPYPDVRRLAVHVLASLGDPNHLPLLDRYRRDASPQVRAEVMLAAGRLGEAGGDLAAGGIRDTSAVVRQAAAWALSHAGDRGCAVLLARLPRERDAAVLETMVGNLFRCAGVEWEAGLADAASSENAGLRRAAAAALARGAGHALLDGLVRDPEPVIRATALAGLVHGPFPPRRVSLVLESLSDPDWRVRAAACGVLAAREQPSLATEVGPRLTALASEGPTYQRVSATRALGAHPEVASTSTILGWTGGESPWLASEALDAVARRAPEASADVVSTWLGSREPWRRRAAATAVVRLAPPLSVELQERVMLDPDPAVRLAWIERLTAIPQDRAAWLRDRMATDPDPAVRSALLDLLAGAGEAGSRSSLLRLAESWAGDAMGDARTSALLAALALSPDARSRREIVSRAAADSDDAVTARVVAAARELGVGASLPPRRVRHDAAWYRDLVAWRDAPRWLDITTEKGRVRISLDTSGAPLSAHEISDLAASGFYDGLTIHRVVPNFVVQGGDPRGDGWGGPGFTLPDEPTIVPFDAWRVGIATSGPQTGGCQLFVTLLPADRLTGHYTNIGEVVDGRDVLTRLEVGDRILRVVPVGGASPPTFTPFPATAP